MVTATKNGAEPEVSDDEFAIPPPSTVVLNIEDNTYSDASSKSLATSTDEEPIELSCNVLLADEPTDTTDRVDSEKKDTDERSVDIGLIEGI